MVYYDANKLVLSDYSFPAKAVVNMMASQFKYNSDDNIITNTDLQYITPHTHKELLSIIHRYIYGNITQQIKNGTEISLRSNGNVDRIHVDKLYTLAKVIYKVGNELLILLGLGESLERGARGIFNTMIKSIEHLLGSNITN